MIMCSSFQVVYFSEALDSQEYNMEILEFLILIYEIDTPHKFYLFVSKHQSFEEAQAILSQKVVI